MVEIIEYDEADMLEQTGESPDVDIAKVYPRADEDLVDFLYRCKNKGSQENQDTSQGVVAAARGGLTINYRREFKSEKRTHVSENYLGKNPMSKTQWRRFQRRKQAEREAARGIVGRGVASGANAGKKVVVKVDTTSKEQIREYVRRPTEKCSDEVTDDFNSESEASLDILVNMVSTLPQEYKYVTEVEESVDDADAEEMALHQPRCYFVLNDGSAESQEAVFERPTMTMKNHLKPLLIRARVEGVTINKVLVDCGTTVNIMSHHILRKIGKYDTDVRSNNIVLSDYGGKTKSTMGVIMVNIMVGSITRLTLFMVIDAKPSYNLLFGREWLHGVGVVPSSAHQRLVI
jgi:hypothetical protein